MYLLTFTGIYWADYKHSGLGLPISIKNAVNSASYLEFACQTF